MPDKDHNSQLEELIRERIRTEGPMPFVEYMGLCLYHPEHGYYMTPRRRIGKQGDFYTSSSVHGMFGRLVARQLVQAWQLLGSGAMTIAEQGAGEGHLALDILDCLRDEYPDCYAAVDYALVEVSPEHRRRQQEILAAHADRVRWCKLDELAGMTGVVLSNELVDAFPVHLVEKSDGCLREIHVGLEDDRLVEVVGQPSTDRIQAHIDWLGAGPLEGSRGEINLAAVDWMRKVAQVLERGLVLTIDYGYPTEELYAPHRRRGTLLCYHRHRSHEDVFAHIGCQDMTSHVDFGALIRSGEESGLETLWFGEQYRFLMALGFVEELMRLQAMEADPVRAQALRLTLKNLILPEGGMGETFKVLVQGKGLGPVELACQRPISAIEIG
ncbi:MAG: SAM-dependent methyltransferase [Geothermobacteraceae bacterium]